MHKEVLNKDQIDLLPLVKQYKREFYLAGGTAVALHIGHRRSVDFDLFKLNNIRHKNILNKIEKNSFSYLVTRRVTEQLNVNIHNVKFTFFEYPFDIKASCEFEDWIKLPSLLDLSSMKAYALGRRSKWKDYIDLYFIIRDNYSLVQIIQNAQSIYGQLFSEKSFRAQISYFKDIDYSEPVEYLVPVPSGAEIKDYLIEKAIDF
jgi:hypothetical protein